MNDTERSFADLARLHDDILRERALGLKDGSADVRAELVAREEAMARLRTQIAELKASIARLDAQKPAPVVAPVSAATPRVIPVTPRISAPVVQTAPVPAPPPVRVKEAVRISATATASSTRAGFATLAPYLVILAFAGVVEARGARRAAAEADYSDLARPAVSVAAQGQASAKGALVVGDEDRSQEALLLVHEWKLPGDDKSLGDRLGGVVDVPGTRPAWSVERTGEKSYRVTYQMSAESASYSFDADLEGRVVWPAPDTAELLAPQLASLRDAPR